MIKIAVSGGHATGKTTLCNSLVALLKSRNLNAGLVHEAVRYSYFMFRGDRNIKMHLESLIDHVKNELLISEYNDILICDRSAIDYLAYLRVRFPGAEDPISRTVDGIVKCYAPTYSAIYLPPQRDDMMVDGDRIRDGENVESSIISSEISDICEELDVPFYQLESNDHRDSASVIYELIASKL